MSWVLVLHMYYSSQAIYGYPTEAACQQARQIFMEARAKDGVAPAAYCIPGP